MLTRRAAVKAATIVTASLSPGLLIAAQKPLVVMTSYPDGGHCSMWRRQVQDDWKKSAQFLAISYQEIYAASSRQLEFKATWPSDLLWLRAQFIDDWRKWTAKDQRSYGGTPATDSEALKVLASLFVAHNEKLVETAAGIGGWRDHIAPTLRSLTGAAA